MWRAVRGARENIRLSGVAKACRGRHVVAEVECRAGRGKRVKSRFAGRTEVKARVDVRK